MIAEALDRPYDRLGADLSMRVFYAVENHSWEDQNLLEGLRQSGHEVVVHRPGRPFHEALGPDWTEADRLEVSERLVSAVRAEHASRPVDVFFGYLLDQLVYPEAIREISDLGILTLNYWCNGAHQFFLVQEISPAFDHCVVTERAALPAYEEVGASPVYLQLAANPDLYRPHDVPVEFDVTFVGQRYADRPEYIDYLLRNGIDARVWGPGWTRDRTFGEQSPGAGVSWPYLFRHPRASAIKLSSYARRRIGDRLAVPPAAERRLSAAAGPSLPYEDLIAMYSRSAVTLGFSTCGYARYRDKQKIRQVHLRDFEAPMSGAFYAVEYQDELNEFYEIGDEIVCYGSREELLEKVRYYLAHPDERERIRKAGYERAQRDHTWKRRFDQLFETVWQSSPA
jgi:spore maturation protein CgeB